MSLTFFISSALGFTVLIFDCFYILKGPTLAVSYFPYIFLFSLYQSRTVPGAEIWGWSASPQPHDTILMGVGKGLDCTYVNNSEGDFSQRQML